MKKMMLFLAFLLMIGQISAQNKKVKVAVMDFKNGVGVEKEEVIGLSDMLINSLYETGKFSIIERSQLNKVLEEQGFQASELCDEQLVQVGKILGVNSILVGTVNFMASKKNYDGSFEGEYNVDVRAVDVESGKIVTTAGATKKSSQTYREMMKKISRQLAKNLADEKEADFETAHFREKGFVIRPEIGWSFAVKEPSFRDDEYTIRGLSAQFSIGYQAGPHLFLGVVGGYGGVCKKGSEKIARINPTIGGDIRWYLIDHEYSFLIDVRGGWGKGRMEDCYYYDWYCDHDRLYNLYFLQISGGFALGNVEISAGWHSTFHSASSININLSYRFGNFKKWW